MVGPGSRLGSYEILSPLGAGGMGEVFRARDTRLGRDVALKLLPPTFASDPDRIARFQREAQVLASLNHPNIAGIFGLEESNGIKALVLELVEGDTLADRITRGPIAADDALGIAGQIAAGVEAAHELGIIHRDLKPANIKVTADGAVKVLDFGLAKLTDQAGAGAQSSSASLSPTITSPALMTNVGMILGTAAYMSPEQAKGRPADKRSDLWSFGCLLHEMLSGRRAFEGEDVTETLAAVIRGEPDWTVLPQDLPPAIRTLIQRCLSKDRRKRPAGMAAVLFVLDEHTNLVPQAAALDERAVRREVDAAVARENARNTRTARVRTLALAGTALLLAAAAAAATWYAMRSAPAPVVRLGLTVGSGPLPWQAASTNDLAITPDGLHVVYYTGATDQSASTLAVRTLDRPDATSLRVVRAFGPFTSPDGQWVGFNAEGSLKRIPINGGPAVDIVSNVGGVRGATWARDDTIIYGSLRNPGLWRVPATAGEPTQLTKPAGGARESHDWPHILPDGRHVLFTVTSVGVDDSRIELLDLQTKTHRALDLRGSYPRYSKTGHIVYAASGTLFAVGFDLERLMVTTAPEPMVEGVVLKESGAASFDLSETGTLVYTPGAAQRGSRRVAWLDPKGAIMSPIEALPPGDYRSVHLNKDATQLVFEAGPGGNGKVWTFDLRRGIRNALTTGNYDDRSPHWSPDERRVVFGSNRDDGWGVFAVNADGSGSVERLARVESAVELWPSSWSGERQLAFSANSGGDGDIGLLTLGNPSIDWKIKTPAIEGTPSISPNGRWIAYTSQRAGPAEVYVERFPELRDRKTVSSEGGQLPLWSRDGRELYYLDLQRTQITTVPVRFDAGGAIEIGVPKPPVKAALGGVRGWRPYDVAPDGRFVVITADSLAGDTHALPIVVPNFIAELTRRVPVN